MRVLRDSWIFEAYRWRCVILAAVKMPAGIGFRVNIDYEFSDDLPALLCSVLLRVVIQGHNGVVVDMLGFSFGEILKDVAPL